MTRSRRLLLLAAVLVCVVLLVWRIAAGRRSAPSPSSSQNTPSSVASNPHSASTSGSGPTKVFAHNLVLRKGPSLRIYVRWLRGEMIPARKNVTPSFDDPESFYLDIQTGVVRVNIGDLTHYLNAGGLGSSPLKNVNISGNGSQINLTGTLHKIIPLPISLSAQIAARPDGLIQLHVTKIDVLKIPFKALLGGFHVTVADLFHPKDIPGVEVSGNDITVDTQHALPPPHIRGQLTTVHVVNPDLEEIYGNATGDVERTEQWRNFLRLSGGAIDFGKLTMNPVDLIMIDISNSYWFDLDLAHYQNQLVNGYTRMTPQAGLQIFMPDVSKLPPSSNNQNIGIEWMRNRSIPVPQSVTQH